jgi:DNA-binding MarR family transcriptional regulator
VTLGSEYNPRIIELLALAPQNTTRLASALKVDDGALTAHLINGLLKDGLIRVCGADGSTPIWELTEEGRKRREQLR